VEEGMAIIMIAMGSPNPIRDEYIRLTFDFAIPI
jgi:hypothetical protein